MTLVRIIAAVVDTRQLLMYKADGNTIIIPQGDPRIRPLVDKVIPELQRLSRMKQSVASTLVYIDLTEEEINQAPTFENNQTHFAEAEKKMGGLVRFFRVAKSKLKELVDKVTGVEVEPVEPTALVGHIPAPADHPTIVQPVAPVVSAPIPLTKEEKEIIEENAPLTKSMDAVNEIMANATPSHSPQFAEGAKDETTTVVAVMEDGTVIPGMENLDLQLRHTAEKLGNPVGIMKFFERLSTVKRGHSVADLLKFMEKGELPIADDGTILVYKRLKSTKVEGEFVDCHSGKVKQRVGSHVFMEESMVDARRSIDCSNGLHVARRDYLSSFSGDICVLAKLAPEDVIAVPHSDARKLRAKGYMIIAVLSQEDHNNVTNNRKLTDTNLLGNAVAGNHTAVIETVQITESYGGGLVITPVGGFTEEVVRDSSLDAKPLKMEEDMIEENSTVDARTLAIDTGKADQLFTAPPGMPKGGYADGDSYRQQAEPSIPATPPPAPKYEAKAEVQLSALGQLVANFRDATTPETKLAAAQALVAHKKTVKKSWTALGITAAMADDALTRVNSVVKVSEVIKPAKASSKKPAVKAKPSAGTKGKTTPPKAAVVKPAVEKAAQSLPKGKPKNDDKMIKVTLPERAKQLMYNVIDGNKQSAKDLLDLKKTSKKSWDYLGVTESQLKQVKELAE